MTELVTERLYTSTISTRSNLNRVKTHFVILPLMRTALSIIDNIKPLILKSASERQIANGLRIYALAEFDVITSWKDFYQAGVQGVFNGDRELRSLNDTHRYGDRKGKEGGDGEFHAVDESSVRFVY